MNLQTLQEALRLSQRMLQLAEQADWETLDALDDERRRLLDAGLADKGTATEQASARGILQVIQDLNSQTLDLLGQGKAQLYESMQLARQRQGAASAYIACEKDSLNDAG